MIISLLQVVILDIWLRPENPLLALALISNLGSVLVYDFWPPPQLLTILCMTTYFKLFCISLGLG